MLQKKQQIEAKFRCQDETNNSFSISPKKKNNNSEGKAQPVVNRHQRPIVYFILLPWRYAIVCTTAWFITCLKCNCHRNAECDNSDWPLCLFCISRFLQVPTQSRSRRGWQRRSDNICICMTLCIKLRRPLSTLSATDYWFSPEAKTWWVIASLCLKVPYYNPFFKSLFFFFNPGIRCSSLAW